MRTRWLVPVAASMAALCSAALADVADCSKRMPPDGEEICQDFPGQGIYGTKRICPGDLMPTPDWEGPEVSAPPLSDEEAREISREAMDRMGFHREEWRLVSTYMQEFCKGRWYFMVTWFPREPNPGVFHLAVSMDGRALVNSHLADGSDGEDGAAADFERHKCGEGEMPIRVNQECATPPERLSRLSAHYPEEALAAGVGGRVVLSFTLLKDGNLRDVKVVLEDPRGLGFAKEARRALAAVEWKPAHTKDHPIDWQMSQSITWKAPD
ncbi:MAG TPA: energy transducer TonB [Candidatus Saccharimonadales bacterium]|nr:energy transducer TonB [Candidatus Saccharimonadales bacterium]